MCSPTSLLIRKIKKKDIDWNEYFPNDFNLSNFAWKLQWITDVLFIFVIIALFVSLTTGSTYPMN